MLSLQNFVSIIFCGGACVFDSCESFEASLTQGPKPSPAPVRAPAVLLWPEQTTVAYCQDCGEIWLHSAPPGFPPPPHKVTQWPTQPNFVWLAPVLLTVTLTDAINGLHPSSHHPLLCEKSIFCIKCDLINFILKIFQLFSD